MLIFIAFTSCFLYSLSSGQTVDYPTIGPVYPVADNDSLLNFTFIYPTNFQFDKLFVKFTLYDFTGNDTLNPTPYYFSWLNFTDSNFSLPWVIPPVILQSGDYIIICFEWVKTDNNEQTLVDTYACALTRTAINSTLLSIANPMISTPIVTDTTVNISAYYPAGLPYDQVNITSTLNETILPSMTNAISNDTYSSINTFIFTNLTSNTLYDICIHFDYSNSNINGTEIMNHQCQTIMTLGNTATATTPANIATTTTTTTATIPANTPIITTPANIPVTTTLNNSCNMILSNLIFIILLFTFVFI